MTGAFLYLEGLFGLFWGWLTTSTIAGYSLVAIFTTGIFTELFVKIWREKVVD